MDLLSDLWLALIALGAAVVNGAVGYGFSSIVTPLGVLWFSNKVLNPALVLVELGVNVTLLVRERRFIRATWTRASTVVYTLFPGVVLGTVGLTVLAVNDVKVILYLFLLPLTALQLWGFRRPIQNERRGGLALGPGIGFLYALTTISGPPLALFFRNQGLSKDEFRCTVAQVRVAESGLTLGTYLAFTQFLGANLVTLPSIALLPFLLVPVVVGVPLGTYLLRSISRETFARFVMAVDGVIVSYGLSRVLVALGWVTTVVSYLILGVLLSVVAVLAAWALSRVGTFQHPAPSPVIGEAEGGLGALVDRPPDVPPLGLATVGLLAAGPPISDSGASRESSKGEPRSPGRKPKNRSSRPRT